jgi:hypothetical protein
MIKDRKPLKAGLKILAIFTVCALIFTSGAAAVFAGPVVIKDKEKGIGTETEERDRSLQDGTLIYSMTPVYPEDFDEGTYDVDALSSSQFFKITQTRLTNEDGRMKAVIRISSTSYSYVYPGTAAEAAIADQSDWIAADETSGFGEFTLDVEALNKEMPCVAYSKKKAKWYDRDIAFIAESLPPENLHVELSADGGTIADTQEAAMQVIYIALAIIVIGGILNHFIKKKFYE